jgi:hypothetical protein
MLAYKLRRASRCWLDADCPSGVLAVYDDPRHADRYTVFYTIPIAVTTQSDFIVGFRGCSERPRHPMGFGEWGEMNSSQLRHFRYANSHRIIRWSELPKEVQDVARADCKDIGGV